MTKIFKLPVLILLIILSTLLLIIITFKYLLLNPSFYKKSLSKDDNYSKIAYSARNAIKQSVLEQINQNYPDFKNQTDANLEMITGQIDEVLAPINATNTKDIVETNLNNILEYLNSKSDKIILYIPINKLGLSDSLSNEAKTLLKDDKVDLKVLAEENSSPNISRLAKLHNMGNIINKAFIINLVLTLILLCSYLLLNIKRVRGALSTYLIILGMVSGLITLMINSIKVESSPTFGASPASIVVASILSPLIVSLAKYWLIVSLSMITISIALIYAPKFISSVSKLKVIKK